MNKPCKCKNPEPRLIGNCEVCRKCGKLIFTVRKNFYKPTIIKTSKKIYNRLRAKKETRKEIENDS